MKLTIGELILMCLECEAIEHGLGEEETLSYIVGQADYLYNLDPGQGQGE